MKTYGHFFVCALLISVLSVVSVSGATDSSADAVVRKLYQQVVARKPLGIPDGADKVAIWPFLSKRLIRRLESAQFCEDDYFRQHSGTSDKPEFRWIEMGLFSGDNEEATPAAAYVVRTVREKDGSFRVYVRLTYKESFETYGRPPDPANKFHWNIAAVVISEEGRFAVDDVLLFKDGSTKIDFRLSNSFPGCDGPHWIGEKTSAR